MIADLLVGVLQVMPDPVVLVEVFDRLLRPETLSRLVVEGLGKGAVYFVIAIGLTLVFGLMGVLNFAHGAMSMLGAYIGGIVILFLVSSGTSQLMSVLMFFVAAAVVFALLSLLGGAIEVGLIRTIYDRNPTYQILLTFGVALILEEGTRIIATVYDVQPEPQWSDPMGTLPQVLETRYSIFGAQIRGFYLFEILLGIFAVAAIWAFLNRTLYGLYIRAGSEDGEMVEALGIDIHRAFTIVFGLGTALAGAGGVLLMWDPLWGPSVLLNIEVLLFSFVVVIIGGLGSFEGTVVAAIIVGITDSITTWLFTTGLVKFSGLTEVSIFVLLVVVLVIRPQGLFGIEEVGGH